MVEPLWRRWESNPRDVPATLDRLKNRTERAYKQSRVADLVVTSTLFHARERLIKGSRTRLYAICDETTDAWKFGIAQDPEARLAALQIGNPRTLVLFAHAPATLALERALHYWIRRDRISGEWFHSSRRVLHVAELVRAAQELCEPGKEVDADAGDVLAALTFALDELQMAA